MFVLLEEEGEEGKGNKNKTSEHHIVFYFVLVWLYLGLLLFVLFLYFFFGLDLKTGLSTVNHIDRVMGLQAKTKNMPWQISASLILRDNFLIFGIEQTDKYIE